MFEAFDFEQTGRIEVEDFINHLQAIRQEKNLKDDPSSKKFTALIEKIIQDVTNKERSHLTADDFLNLLYEYMDQE